MNKTIKRSRNRKADIIKTARDLFQQKDYEKATMQDVMDILGIAKGTIYHYFKSKEDLLEAVIEDIVEKSMNRMETVVKESKGNALAKIKLLVTAGRIDEENSDLLSPLHQPANYLMHTRLLAATLIKQAPLYAELIQQGCEEGFFKTKTPLECAEFILSGIQFLTDQGIYPWAEEDLNRRMQAFPGIVEQLLHAPRGSFQFLFS